MIAVAGRDMAARDAPARAAGVPVCALLGGSVGPVPAYNSNGLGLRSPTDRRARSSSRASIRIQLPACNTRFPTPATLGPPELHYPSNPLRRPVEGVLRTAVRRAPSKLRMLSISLSYWRQQGGWTMFRAK
jgi:hypothetical protein